MSTATLDPTTYPGLLDIDERAELLGYTADITITTGEDPPLNFLRLLAHPSLGDVELTDAWAAYVDAKNMHDDYDAGRLNPSDVCDIRFRDREADEMPALEVAEQNLTTELNVLLHGHRRLS